jgi:DHA1 family bicyclomycin/chloramphenicol resistance-like MFS transporter
MNLLVICLAVISSSIELDIYIPSLTNMIEYFDTTPVGLQWLFSLNFIGLAISGLFCGYLSDLFGRKQIIIIGLVIFFLGSVGCVFSNTLVMMCFFRLIQGIGCAAPITISFAIIPDLFNEKHSSQLISLLNSVVTASMAGAPVIGNWLNINYGWRSNFVVIMVLSLLSLLGFILLFKEQKTNRNISNYRSLRPMLKRYQNMIVDYKFILLACIPSLIYACLILYLTLLPYLFIDNIGISHHEYGFYQMSIMATFFIFSLFSIKLYNNFNIIIMQKLGKIICGTACISFCYTALLLPLSPVAITISMCIFTSGSALCLGSFIVQGINYFPKFKGASSAMLGTIKLIITAITVWLGSILFNGSISSIAILICTITGLAFLINNKISGSV